MKKNRSLSSFIKLPIYSLFFVFIAWSAYWFLGTIYIENKVLENNNLKVVHCSFKDFAGWLILVIFRFLKIKPKYNKKLLILYDKLFFPFLKYLDLIGGKFIGKNIFVVAKLLK